MTCSVFLDRDGFRRVEQGGGRREDEALDAVFGGGFEQVGGGDDVIAQVFERLLHTFRHDDVRGEVENAVELMRVEKLRQRRAIHQIADDQAGVFVNGFPMPGDEAVEDDDFVALADQQIDHVAADIARATRDKYLHSRASLPKTDQKLPSIPTSAEIG